MSIICGDNTDDMLGNSLCTLQQHCIINAFLRIIANIICYNV